MINRVRLVNISSLLFCLLPLALLTGPFIPDLFVCFISIIFLYISINEKLWTYYESIFFKIFITFYFILIISSFLSEFQIFSLKSSLAYIRFGIFVLATWFLIENKKNLIYLFSVALFYTLLLAIISGYWQYFNETNFLGYSSSNNRLSLLANDNLILGGYLSRMFPFTLGLLLLFKVNSKKLIFFMSILIIFLIILVYLSGERTAIFHLILSSLFIIIFINKYIKVKIFIFGLSLLLITTITYYNNDIRNRNINFTLTQINLYHGYDNIRFFSHHHSQLAKTSINMFKDNQLIGVGPNNFRKLSNDDRYYIDDYSLSTHPHNSYLQLLAETGILGFSIISFIFLYFSFRVILNIFTTYYKKIKLYDNFQICLICSFLISLWPLSPSLNFFNNWICIIYFLPIGFFLHSVKIKKKKSVL